MFWVKKEFFPFWQNFPYLLMYNNKNKAGSNLQIIQMILRMWVVWLGND